MTTTEPLQRIAARTLLQIPAADLWNWITGPFILVMDDMEEIPTNHVETCYSSYAWDFHRRYPNTPLLAEHHIRGILRWDGSTGIPGRLSINADLDLFGNCMMATYDAYRDTPEKINRVTLWKQMAEMMNFHYCHFIKYADRYVGTIDILHFHEAMDDPEIYAANQAVQRGEIHIHEVYAIIDRVFKKSKRLMHNPLVREYRSKLLKQTQVHQNIGPRGRPTDMNSRIFQHTIRTGYVEGINPIADSAIETRSAARASYYAAESLRMSEYFSRKLQFVSQNVRNIHQDCDCGSTQYLEWKMHGSKKDENGEEVRASDLILLDGKYYLNERTGQLEPIRRDSVHLLGQTVRLRTTLHCAHPDPVGVCSTCFGELAFNVPPDANIGQWCATTMAEQATQALLSAKHLEKSSALERIVIDPPYDKYIAGGLNNSSYVLSKEIEDKDVSIILLRSQVESLHDIKNVEDIEEHPEEHYSELTTLNIKIAEGLDTPMTPTPGSKNQVISSHFTVAVPVGVVGSREASLSYEMLNYIREHGYRTVSGADGQQRAGQRNEDRYEIDMTDWNWDDPILVMPAKHFNNSDHVDQVARRLESRVAEMRKRARIETADKMILDLFNFVNMKLNVNLSCLEVILYATTIISAEHNDYGLPKPWTTSQPSVLSMTMKGRSLSVLMAFEKQYEALIDPASFIHTNRLDHLFDGIYTPTQVYGNPQLA
jgi:hypothetical protein